jgi:hypothetical protein
VVAPLTDNNKVVVGAEVEVAAMTIADHNDNHQPDSRETLLSYKAKSSTALITNKQIHSLTL